MLVVTPLVGGVAVGGLAVWARSEGGRAWLRDRLVGLVAPVHGTLSVGALETDLFSTATLRDVSILGPDGARLVHADALVVRYRLGGLVARRLVVPEARVEGLDVALAATPNGLDIATLWDDGTPSSGEPWGGLPIDLAITSVTTTGARFAYRDGDRTYGATGLDLRAGVELRGPAVLVTGLTLAAPETTPALGALALAGDARWDPNALWLDDVALALGPNRAVVRGGLGALQRDVTVGLGLTELHVEPGALAPLLGALPVTGAFDAKGSLAGLLAAPTLAAEVVTPGGPVHVAGRLDTRGPRPVWSAELVPTDVALHAFLPDVPAPTILRGALSAHGEGFGWPDDLDATATLALEAPALGAWTDLSAYGDVRLAAGVLTLDGLRAAGPGVGAEGSGTVRILDHTGAVALTGARADLAALARVGVPGVRGAASFRGDATFGWGDRLGVRVDGALRGANVAYADVGAAKTVAGPIAATWDPAAGTVASGRLALTGVSAPSVTATTADLDGRVTVSPKGTLDAAATVALTGVASSGATVGAVSGPVTLRRDRALHATADLVTTDVAWEAWRSDAGAARLALDGDAATFRVDLRDGGRPMVVLDGEADLRARSVRARELVLAPTEDLAWRGEGVQSLRVVEGGVEDVRLHLAGDSGVVRIDGGGAKKAAVDLRLEARDVRLERLAALLPGRFDGYAGRVSVRASMEGPAARPALYVDLSAEDLTIPDAVRRADVTLQATGGDRRLKLDGTVAAATRPLARVQGELPFSLAIDDPGVLPDGEMTLRLLVPPAASDAWSAVLPGEPLPAFRASGEVTLTGPVLDPALGVVATVDAPVGPTGDWLRFDVDARSDGDRLALRAVARERFERRLELDGGVGVRLAEVARQLFGRAPAKDLGALGTWLGDLDVNVVPMRLPVQVLAGFVDGFPARLSGDLSGGVNVAGPLTAPRVQGALLLQGGRFGDLEVTPAEVVVEAKEGGYGVSARLGFDKTSVIVASGFVPFAPTLGGDLAAELRRDGLDLAITATDVPLTAVAAAWPRLEATKGTFSIAGTVKGSVLDPAPDLHFGLSDADFYLLPTGVRYTDARFTGRVTRDTLAVEGLSARTVRAGASLGSGVGALALAESGRVEGAVTARRVEDHPVFDGTLTLDRAWITDLPGARLRMSGDLRLGERAKRLRVSGRLSVVDGNLIVPERFFTGTSDLGLPPDVRVLRRGAVSAASTSAAGFTFPDWLDADIAVNLDRSAFLEASMPMEQLLGRALRSLSSIQLSTQLDGEVTARVSDGALSLVGEVRPLRGTARVFNRPFDVQGNTISFTGRDYTDPVLDLVAVHQSADYGAITTTITGTPSDLSLAFSAEDDALAQEDILGVLVAGRPLSELGAGEGDVVSALVTSGLVGVAEDLGAGVRFFDVFEVDMNHLRVGNRIRNDLFVLGEVDWSADPELENLYQVTLEWRVARKWQLDLTTGNEGFSSLSFNRKWRF